VGVLALFNISAESKPETGTISIDDIYGLEGMEYIAYGYFSKKFYRLNKDTEIEITLNPEQCEIFNFYPVKDGKILLGDTTKYISGASSEKVETDINELI